MENEKDEWKRQYVTELHLEQENKQTIAIWLEHP